MATDSLTIYHRDKDPHTGKWRNPKKVTEGRGHSTGDLKPPFSVRPVINGRQKWHPLDAQTFIEAKEEAARFCAKLRAAEQGADIPEINESNRVTIEAAVRDYLEYKEHEVGRRPRSIKQYRTALNEFADNAKVRYINEITESVLRRYHEERQIPLSDEMLKQLKDRSKNPGHPRWIFVNGDNNPESHFLDKFKRIALRSGVNFGHCVTSRNDGKDKKPVEVSCKTHPVCEKMILHRLRKTTATAWHESRVPVRTIQHWLGHSSLEITQLYLGITDSGELRHEINATRRRIYGD